MRFSALIFFLLSLLAAPLLTGWIVRVKALFAGRRGAPVTQLYRDLFRLLRKGAVYSRSTSPLFWLAPMITLAATVAALALLPLPGYAALIAFPGDLILFAYLFALGRFFTILAALDTASAFEGMGASREAWYAIFAELILFLGLATLVRFTNSLSLSQIFESRAVTIEYADSPALALLLVSLFVAMLAENSRIPVDDPATHLELTMIHEVMVLDHSGPDFAFILYGAALKLWIWAMFLTLVIISSFPSPNSLRPLIAAGVLFIIATAIGIVESVMARLRLERVPQMLMGAGALGLLSYIILG
ncbi:MAG TPA: NADH-quinone oxidoreductase subunit H [bacterium]|nr:NADH-quinone oxidoreductase subunit H [bacterium]HOC90122.1 NADH-quinone oxidoreductase subunit H [bacterium]HOZ21081.1 NADH-quinone oxidoreductase subunit H [bacterium]